MAEKYDVCQLLGLYVRCSKGVGKLWQVFESRVGVEVAGRVEFLPPHEVWAERAVKLVDARAAIEDDRRRDEDRLNARRQNIIRQNDQKLALRGYGLD